MPLCGDLLLKSHVVIVKSKSRRNNFKNAVKVFRDMTECYQLGVILVSFLSIEPDSSIQKVYIIKR